MIGEQVKGQLAAKGYYVENMTEANGPGWWDGMFRWINEKTGNFQDSEPSLSEEEAWESCLSFAQMEGEVPA